jgi:two-component system, NarL family, sensor histidine kinase EvgS
MPKTIVRVRRLRGIAVRGLKKSPRPDTAASKRGGKCILLVEDHAALRRLRSAFLTGEGYCVTCAEDGLAALALLDAQPFHVVVTDAALPGASGWEVAEAASARGVPVILSSGWLAAVSAGKVAARGVSFLCPKPSSLSQLQLLIEKALRLKRAGSRARKPDGKTGAGPVL